MMQPEGESIIDITPNGDVICETKLLIFEIEEDSAEARAGQRDYETAVFEAMQADPKFAEWYGRNIQAETDDVYDVTPQKSVIRYEKK